MCDRLRSRRPRQGENDAGEDAGKGDRQHLSRGDLPAGGTQCVGAFPDGVRHGAQRLLRGDDDGQDQESHGQGAGKDATLQEATSVSYARITACHLVGRLRRLAAASNVSRRKVRVFPLPGDAGRLPTFPCEVS